MKVQKRRTGLVAVLCSLILVGGMVAVAAPAVAAVDWGKIWKTEIKPRADKRYYTKKASNNRYYTKAQANAKFAPYPKVVRGVWAMGTTAAATNGSALADISFGFTFAAAPTAHYIKLGDPLPTGCSGTPAAPNAAPGHLCVFEQAIFGPMGATANKGVCSSGASCPGASPSGALLYAYTTAAGTGQLTGSWAARPATGVTARMAPAPAPSVSGDAVGR